VQPNVFLKVNTLAHYFEVFINIFFPRTIRRYKTKFLKRNQFLPFQMTTTQLLTSYSEEQERFFETFKL